MCYNLLCDSPIVLTLPDDDGSPSKRVVINNINVTRRNFIPIANRRYKGHQKEREVGEETDQSKICSRV